MCGRYADFLTEQELIDAFEIAVAAGDPRLAPRYNIGPTQEVAIVVASKEPGNNHAPGADAPASPGATVPSHSLEWARWGLVPSWAKDPAIGSRMINARAETVATKPSFRAAFAKRRCLIPASGYFEWQAGPGGKTPYFIYADDRSPLAFAGLYEFWRAPSAGATEAPAGTPWLATCTILTTAARGSMTSLHDRQPVMLTPKEARTWLDPSQCPDDLFAAIDAPTMPLAWHPVGRAVGNIRNQGDGLIVPAT